MAPVPRPIRIGLSFVVSIPLTCWLGLPLGLSLGGCAHHAEARAVKEAAPPTGLGYTLQIDATRLSRGSGLAPVPAVTQLVEENLAAYFKIESRASGGKNDAQDLAVLIAESAAPTYAVRARIEARPDDYCMVRLEAVRFSGEPTALEPRGAAVPVELAPYSVHYGLVMVRAALAALRPPNRPTMSEARFTELRAQATALAQQGQDPPIDEATFARTPRPLDRLDENPRYYAPVADEQSGLRR